MRYRVIVVVALAMMIFTVTSSILSGLLAAPATFAGQGDHVVLSADASTIFSSRVDADLLPSLLSQEAVTAAWAEIVALSAWNGRAFIVRGIDLASILLPDSPFASMEVRYSAALDNGRSAIVGSRLLERLGVEPPYTLPLTGSYSSHVEFVEVVGSFDSGTYLDDEMLVHLEVARYLCGMPAGMVSAIGVSTDDPEWLANVLSPSEARFALFDIRASRSTAVAGEEISVTADVVNWGSELGEVSVFVEEGETVLDEIVVSLDASETATVTSLLSFDSLGTHTIDFRMTGTMPIEASLNITVVEPYLSVAAPPRAVVGADIEVFVTTHDGAPVEGAEVAYAIGDDDGTISTDEFGSAGISAAQAGEMTIVASSPGYDEGSAIVEVVDLSTFPDEFLPVVRSFTIAPTTVPESDDVIGSVVVENAGAAGGWYELPILVDASEHSSLNVSLGPADICSAQITLEGLSVGVHSVQIGTYSREVTVEPWYADEPDIVQLVIRYGGTGTLSSSTSIPIYQAAKLSEGNIAVALISIGAISALLSVLAISAVFAKEVHEGRDTLGILRTLGASNAHIRRIVIPQALAGGLAGAAIGIATGVAAAILLVRSGAFLIFSHEFTFDVDVPLLVAIAIGAAAISVLSAAASAEVAVRETPIASMRKLDDGGPTDENTPEEIPGNG
jgi:ABC-type lipoprotein release transport system permease subunit